MQSMPQLPQKNVKCKSLGKEVGLAVIILFHYHGQESKTDDVLISTLYEIIRISISLL